jgi:hypothetical protein
MNMVIMLITIIIHSGQEPVAQTAIETTLATCQQAQQQLNGTVDLSNSGRRIKFTRTVECIRVK